MWTGQRRTTRGFLATSIVVLAVPAAIVGWLGWMLLQQDRQLERQRVHDRLKPAADLAVSSLERALSSAEDRLSAMAGAAVSNRAASAAAMLGGNDGAIVVVLSGSGLWSSAPLIYYPNEADFSDTAAADFADAERNEFILKDLASALSSYRALARSNDRVVRAGALARAARVARNLGQPGVALETYDALAALGSTAAVGRPADLVASLERCAVLSEMGQNDRLTAEARQLQRRLAAGEWPLSRSQYRFYRKLTAGWLGQTDSETTDGSSLTSRETLAAGVQLVSNERDALMADGAERGRQMFGSGPERGVILWRRSNDLIAALIATPSFAARAWFDGLRSIEDSQVARISVSGVPGDVWYGPGSGGDVIRRTAEESGLPFSVSVATSDPAGDTVVSTGRRRLLVGMIAGLGLLFVIGGYATARGLARELAAARLQSDFVAAVSHEFRTPVASVRQLSELLDDGRVPDESRRGEYYGLLRRESERLQRLVENLLDFGRMESAAAEYRFESIDLETFLREITDGFGDGARLSGHRLEILTKTPLPVMHGDREALGRALSNLLDNAMKYSPPGTTISVEAETLVDRVAIRVRDQGPGLATGEQQRIFQKFFRGTNARAGGAKGTGLGLAMVKHIVEAHHGSVGVESRLGAGATFTILLPLEAAG